jgi:hypothetical protein
MIDVGGIQASAEAKALLRRVLDGKTDGVSAWLSAAVQQIERPRTQGHSLVAAVSIPANTMIAIKQGRVLSETEVKDIMEVIDGSHQQIGPDRFLAGVTVEEVRKNRIGFNHSCVPNAYIKLVEALPVALLVSRKPIAAGREITADYAASGDSITHFIADCKCGVVGCRQVIDPTRDWQSRDFQARYAGEFPAFMQEKIDRLQQVDLMNRPILT